MLCDECHRKLNRRGICTNLKCAKFGKDPSRVMPDSLKGQNVDPFKLAKRLKGKKGSEKHPPNGEIHVVSNLPRCPNERCRQIALSWNERLLLYQCSKCRGMFSKYQVDVAYKVTIRDVKSGINYHCK